MSAGSFLSGMAGGYSDGRKARDRRSVIDAMQSRSDNMQSPSTLPPPVTGNANRNTAMAANGGPTNAAARAMNSGVGSADDRDILARTLMAEAGGEGYTGMLAAGSVIANRANARGYGDGIKGVIMKPGQFSAWNSVTGYAGGEGGLDMDSMTPTEEAYRAADAILGGGYEDPTGGATHYYNPSVATPKWGKQNGGDWQTIGNHVFGFADGKPTPRRAPTQTAQASQPASPPPARPAQRPAPPQGGPRRSVVPEETPAQKMLRMFYSRET